MSHILCSWELGSGAGHVLPLSRVLAELVARGHQVTMAVRSLPAARRVLDDLPVRLLQAPLWTEPPPGRAPAGNYAQLLERVGYATADGVAALVTGWRSLLTLTEPDLLLAEHSPTALLAARIDGVPAVVAGTGFTLPPLCEPMPTILPGATVSARGLRRAEDDVRARINTVLTEAGAVALASLSELLCARERVLWTFPELDHYVAREGDDYQGPVIATPKGGVDWPQGDGPRVFAYYHAGYPGFGKVVKALTDLEQPTLLVAGGGDRDAAAALGNQKLKVRVDAVDLDRVGREAAVVVSHTGFNSVATTLLAGCPQVMVPHFVEQRMLAYRVRERGLGEFSPTRSDLIVARARKVLSSQAHREAALALAARYRDFDRLRPLVGVADACERVSSRSS